MISATAEYALRAAVYLAKRQGTMVSRIDIASATKVPVDYLLKVLNALDEAGIVVSKRGPGGGYALIRPSEETTVLDVVSVVDEFPRVKKCPLGIAGHKQLCPLHQLLDEAAQRIEESFRAVTIKDLMASKRNPLSCSFPRLNE